jgi:hypothetical protein
MTIATRACPTNKYCTDCGEEVRQRPETDPLLRGFVRHDCSCTMDLSHWDRHQHEVRAWRPL